MSLTHEKVLLGWGEPKQATAMKPDCPCFYFPDFFLTLADRWTHYLNWSELTIAELKALFSTHPKIEPVQWIVDRPGQFKTAFDQLTRDIQANRLKKGVPYLFAKTFGRMTAERLSGSLTAAIAALEKKAGYLYGQWNSQGGILGVTPEILFTHRKDEPNMVRTMAVAGTCHPSQDQEAFFHNEKERHEHRLVVEGICQSLQPLGSLEVGEMHLLRLPKLIHMKTPIALKLSQPFYFDALVEKLHPTPALGAFPVKEGKFWLADFDKHTPRRLYGAPVGFRDPKTGISHCFVSIRNVQWDAAGMQIGAGCGVVRQSTFAKEWHEIHLKLRAIRQQLAL